MRQKQNEKKNSSNLLSWFPVDLTYIYVGLGFLYPYLNIAITETSFSVSLQDDRGSPFLLGGSTCVGEDLIIGHVWSTKVCRYTTMYDRRCQLAIYRLVLEKLLS